MNKTLNAYYKEQILKLKENITSLKAKKHLLHHLRDNYIYRHNSFYSIIHIIYQQLMELIRKWDMLGSIYINTLL